MNPEISQSLTDFMAGASFLFVAFVLLIIHLANKRLAVLLIAAVTLIGWYGLVVLIGRTGFFATNPLFFPFIIFGFVGLYIILKRVYRSPAVRSVFAAIPIHWLHAVQILRVMGYGFLTAAALRLLPAEFAIPTGIGDVIIGLTAPVFAYLSTKKTDFAQKASITWNYLGIADLIIAISLGIVTFPRPFQLLPTEVVTTNIALFPFVIVPLFAVPVSIMIHLFAIRGLNQTPD